MLKVNRLSGGYSKTPMIKDISFSLSGGQLLFIIGQNGSGKTTLFKLILGLLDKSNGSVSIDGVDTATLSPKERAGKIAYIPQQHEPVFDYTVREMVMMGRTSHIGMFASPSKQDEAAVDAAIEMLNLEAFADREYSRLSGGEMQMVLIARAVCQQAKMIIMDEPMMNLDYRNQAMVASAVEHLQKQGYAILISTHNMVDIGFQNAYVLLIKNGRCVGFGSAAEMLNSDRLKAVYDIEMDVLKMEDSSGKKRFVCFPR